MAREQVTKPAALRLAIVGAESTGKTTLAAALAPRIAADSGLSAVWVPEALRAWCDNAGRTPLAHEQAAILHAQNQRIEEAAATHDVVVCDTTALMTAVYSRLVFGDRSLEQRALALQQRMSLTLLMALDLPWVPDGLQRDGPQVQAPVDAALRELLMASGLPWALVSGSGEERLEHALDAVAPLLRNRSADTNGQTPRNGLFTRLSERNARDRPWVCSCCDDADCERQLQASQERPQVRPPSR